jgi:prolyl oligopeptidase PreP (S9A serine peptidase family)
MAERSGTRAAEELMKTKPPSCDLVEYLHTRTIADPYRPLENLTAKKTLSWVRAQTQKTEAEVFDPARVQAFVARLSETFKSYPTQSSPVRGGDRTMAFVNSGIQPHDVLMVKSKNEESTVLREPNT